MVASGVGAIDVVASETVDDDVVGVCCFTEAEVVGSCDVVGASDVVMAPDVVTTPPDVVSASVD